MINRKEDRVSVSSSCCALNEGYIFLLNNWQFRSPWEECTNSRLVLDVLSSASLDRTSRCHRWTSPSHHLNLHLKPCYLLKEEHGSATPASPSQSGTAVTNVHNIRPPLSPLLVCLCLGSLPLSAYGDSACWVSWYPSQRWAIRCCWSFQPEVSVNGCFSVHSASVTVTQKQHCDPVWFRTQGCTGHFYKLIIFVCCFKNNHCTFPLSVAVTSWGLRTRFWGETTIQTSAFNAWKPPDKSHYDGLDCSGMNQ